MLGESFERLAATRRTVIASRESQSDPAGPGRVRGLHRIADGAAPAPPILSTSWPRERRAFDRDEPPRGSLARDLLRHGNVASDGFVCEGGLLRAFDVGVLGQRKRTFHEEKRASFGRRRSVERHRFGAAHPEEERSVSPE